MPRITFTQPDGIEKTVEAEVGCSLMEVEVAAGIVGIEAICGGACMCATARFTWILHRPSAFPLRNRWSATCWPWQRVAMWRRIRGCPARSA